MSGHKITRSVSFDSEKDARILALTKAKGKRHFSETVRRALLAYFDLETGVTLRMLYSRLGDIERKLDSGIVVSGGGGEDAQGDAGGDTLSDDILGAFD